MFLCVGGFSEAARAQVRVRLRKRATAPRRIGVGALNCSALMDLRFGWTPRSTSGPAHGF